MVHFKWLNVCATPALLSIWKYITHGIYFLKREKHLTQYTKALNILFPLCIFTKRKKLPKISTKIKCQWTLLCTMVLYMWLKHIVFCLIYFVCLKNKGHMEYGSFYEILIHCQHCIIDVHEWLYVFLVSFLYTKTSSCLKKKMQHQIRGMSKLQAWVIPFSMDWRDGVHNEV